MGRAAITSKNLTAEEKELVARFVRDEPLWPLLKSIWKLRRMPGTVFEVACWVINPWGLPGR